MKGVVENHTTNVENHTTNGENHTKIKNDDEIESFFHFFKKHKNTQKFFFILKK